MKYKKSLIHGKNRFELELGFTVVELLVVIVVIGILAAITIVSYTGITQKATAATLQSDLKNASTQLEMDKVTNGTYPATKEDASGGKGLSKSSDTIYQYTGTASSYCLTATSGNIAYFISSGTGIPAEGVCPGHVAPGSGQAMVWEQITVGGDNTCAIANSKAYCWGYNNVGQLGNNTTTDSSTPVPVNTTGALAGKTVTAITTGSSHTCAIANGQAYCWGYNGYGRLGNNTTTNSSVPVPVDTTGALAGKTVTEITTEDDHTCAIANNQVYCWGYNSNGQLGNNTTTNSFIPVPVDTTGALAGKPVTAITVNDSDTCAIANGQAYCWGYKADTTTPGPVDTTGALAGKTITAIEAGYESTCVIASNQAYCWGNNSYGQLGNNTTTNSSIPVPVDTTGVLAGKTVTAITVGYVDTCAIANGQAYCWGYYTGSITPALIDATGALAGKTITTIESSDSYMYHTCAIANGQAYCWGANNTGQLGYYDRLSLDIVPGLVVSK